MPGVWLRLNLLSPPGRVNHVPDRVASRWRVCRTSSETKLVHAVSRRTRACNVVALCSALVLATIALLVEAAQSTSAYQGSGLIGPLYALDAAVQDVALRAREPAAYVQQPGQDQRRVDADPRTIISIVAIDDATIAQLGAYNGGYSRRLHAALIEQLLQAPPRVLAFDIGFFEPTSDDDVLAAALDHARAIGTRVVLADVGLLSGSSITRTGEGELEFDSRLEPLPALAHRGEVGLANVLPDTRGTIRSMPLVARVGGEERPTLGLAALAAFLRRPTPIDGRPRPGTLVVAGRDVPVDGTDSLLINYFGPPAQTFPVISFAEVLNGRADSRVWRDGIVFVGALGATGLAEDYWTPVSDEGRKMAGVEIHANVLATLFSTQFLRAAPLQLQVVLTIALAIAAALVAANLPVLGASVAGVMVLLAYGTGAIASLYGFGVVLPMAEPLLAAAGAFVVTIAYRVVAEQRQSRALQVALAAVVPPEVATQIARQPERIPLESQRRVLSVLFADLADFTPFSERSDPELVSRVIGDFLQAMTSTVFAHGGTVDKFIGDAVMAFWNAPLDDPAHARNACAAALAMQDALQSLCTRWSAGGLPEQRMRIGIHTGPASVGNMGTRERFAYTAIGDTINLAARLEPLNNVYGSRISISENTLDAAGGKEHWLVRFLDRVAVKGRASPVTVFELLGSMDDATRVARYSALLDCYDRAMRLYEARDFAAAQELFGAAGIQYDDVPSRIYADRCAAFMVAPPPVDWDGVFVMQRK